MVVQVGRRRHPNLAVFTKEVDRLFGDFLIDAGGLAGRGIREQ